MNRKELLRYLYYVVLVIVTGIMVLLPVRYKTEAHSNQNKILKGVITEHLETMEEGSGESKVVSYKYLAVITEGKYKDEVVEIEDNVSALVSYHIPAEVGDDILIYPELSLDKSKITKAYLSNYNRSRWIMILISLFIILILLVGRMKGVKAIISLAVTLLLVVKVFLPRVIVGQDPIWLSIFVASWTTILTMSLVSGMNKKTIAAIFGTIGGVIFGALIAVGISHQAKIVGFTFSEAQQLLFLPQGTDFNFKGLLFATILLGALGAVMDVAMSISSSIFELRSMVSHELTIKELYNSGMNIGRDVMGTMINTLVLAYVGSSMHILIIIIAYNIEFYNVINNDAIVTEIVRAFAGTSGLIVAVPLTAIIAAVLHKGDA